MNSRTTTRVLASLTILLVTASLAWVGATANETSSTASDSNIDAS